MARRDSKRIYWRERGGDEPRAYGDFRDFADVGGGREALKPPGAKQATTDPEIAEKLAADRVEELQERRRRKVLHGIERTAGLKEFAAHHLREKAKTGSVSEAWLKTCQTQLERVVAFLGAERDLNAITPRALRELTNHLLELPNGRGQDCPECGTRGELGDSSPLAACPECDEDWRVGTLSESTVRKHLNTLSNLYRRAESEGYVPSGYNPVASMVDKPTEDTSSEADWLEIDQATLYLEAARHYDPPDRGHPIPFARELIAVYLLTGGRKEEVLGLEVEDISFDRRTVRFRPNEHRGLKTSNADRSVPLWPQLQEILTPYIIGDRGPTSGLLFPSPKTGKKIHDLRSLLDNVGSMIGWPDGRVRTKMLRHTYCAARLQTTDRGQPISKYTVAQELGHGGTTLVDRVYGHLGEVRHRSDVVEYRPENHMDTIGEKVWALRAHDEETSSEEAGAPTEAGAHN